MTEADQEMNQITLKNEIDQRLASHENFYQLFGLPDGASSQDISEVYRQYEPFIDPDSDYDVETYNYITSVYRLLSDEKFKGSYDGLEDVERRKLLELFQERHFKESEYDTDEQAAQPTRLQPPPGIRKLYRSYDREFEEFLSQVKKGKWDNNALILDKIPFGSLDALNYSILKRGEKRRQDYSVFKINYHMLGHWYQSCEHETSEISKVQRFKALAAHMSDCGLPDSWITITGAKPPEESSESGSKTAHQPPADLLDKSWTNPAGSRNASSRRFLAIRKSVAKTAFGNTELMPNTLFFFVQNGFLSRCTARDLSLEKVQEYASSLPSISATHKEGKEMPPALDIKGFWSEEDNSPVRYPVTYFWVSNSEGGEDVHTRTSLNGNMGSKGVKDRCKAKNINFLKDQSDSDSLAVANLSGRLQKLLVANGRPMAAGKIARVIEHPTDTIDTIDEEELFVPHNQNMRVYRSNRSQLQSSPVTRQGSDTNRGNNRLQQVQSSASEDDSGDDDDFIDDLSGHDDLLPLNRSAHVPPLNRQREVRLVHPGGKRDSQLITSPFRSSVAVSRPRPIVKKRSVSTQQRQISHRPPTAESEEL